MRITKRKLRGFIREAILREQGAWGSYAQEGSDYWSDVIVMSPHGDSVLVDGNETHVQDVPMQLENASGFPVDEAFAKELVTELETQMQSGYVEISVNAKNGAWSM